MYANHQFVCARRYSCPCPIRCRVNNMKNTGQKQKLREGKHYRDRSVGGCVYVYICGCYMGGV